MNNSSVNRATIQSWIDDRLSYDTVEKTLVLDGFETAEITEYLQQFKKLKNANKQITGFVFMAVGAFIGFLACVMAMINPMPDMQDFFLFGLTLIAVGMMMYGMYLVFD